MFTGTLRFNLDPEGAVSDERIIELLKNLILVVTGLDLVVRDSSGHVLTPEKTSAVALYRQHVSRYKHDWSQFLSRSRDNPRLVP